MLEEVTPPIATIPLLNLLLNIDSTILVIYIALIKSPNSFNRFKAISLLSVEKFFIDY